jgi:hypothetical protein
MTKKEKVYLISYKDDYFRKGEPCEVVGLKMLTVYKPNSLYTIKETTKLCYYVVFEDGQVDYIDKELADKEFSFVTLDDMLRYGTP